MSETLIKVENVAKKFCRNFKRSLLYGLKDIGKELCRQSNDCSGKLRIDEFWAVKDVSFELKRGECLGLIGLNGAGKTTLLRMLNGLIKPDKGRIEMRGHVGALIALGAGFNPILTGRENIYINAAILGLSKREINAKIKDIIEFAEIEEFIDSPVQSYSSGMAVRLGFAIATALNPDVLIIDEIFAVGDVNFRMKCTNKINNLLIKAAVVIVSHEAHVISRVCNRALLLNKGECFFDGNPHEALTKYADLSQASMSDASKQIYIELCDYVASVDVLFDNKPIKSNGILYFKLLLNMRCDAVINRVSVNIIDSFEVVHAQFPNAISGQLLTKGVNIISFRLGPLHLSRNRFFANIAIYSHDGKVALAIIRRKISFDFDGPISLGPCYYPDFHVEVIEK